MMPDRNNHRRGRAMREIVAMYLQAEGIETAEARPPIVRKLSERLDDPIVPDILGVPGGWFLETHSDLSPTWGRSLDQAEQSAALAGFPRAATVQYRKESTIAQAYVVMSLHTFAGLLRRYASDFSSLQEFEDWALQQQETDE